MSVAHIPPPVPQTSAYVQAYTRAKPCPIKKTSTSSPVLTHHFRLKPHSSIPQFKVVGLERLWTLHAGKATSHELAHWGHQAHWTVLWQLPKDVVVPATAVFYGTFQSAVTRVANTLSAEGLLLKADIYESNRTVVIRAPGESK